jgi:predicted DNA-binding protein with PD1-like motif
VALAPLGVLHLHVVLKVDNPMGTGLHLLPGEVEQHTGVVLSMLGITKATVNLL